MRVEVHPKPQSPEEWEERFPPLQYCGAHSAAAILGLNKWEQPLTTYLRKRGLVERVEATEQMEWGSLMEGVILDGYAKRRGVFVHNESRGVHVAGWMLAPLDGIEYAMSAPDGANLVPLAVLDAKNIRSAGPDWGPDGSDQYPAHYYAQLQWYMAVTGLKLGRLVVLFSGCELRVYTAEADEGFQQDMIEQAKAFMENTRNGIPPPLMPERDDAVKAVTTLHGYDKERIANLYDDSHKEALDWWRIGKGEAAYHTDVMNAGKARLLDALKGAGVGVFADGTTLKSSQRLRNGKPFYVLTVEGEDDGNSEAD